MFLHILQDTKRVNFSTNLLDILSYESNFCCQEFNVIKK